MTDHQIDSEGRGTSFRAGDLLFSKLRPYLAKSWVANRDGEALGDIHVYRPVDEMCSRYLGYLVLSSFFLEQVNASTYGTKMPRANWDFIKTIEVWAPDFDTQRRIADYLDRETARIDALIEKQRALVAGLRRRRVAAIVAATSGMQANGDRGESASSWLKYMPAHWSELPIKRILTDVQSGYWGSDEVGDGTDVRVVRVADFDRPTLSVGTAPTIRSVTPSERAKAALRRGDLLMEKSGGTGINPVGFVVSYESDEESIFANFIVRLRPRPDQHARFWLYALNGAYTSGLTWKSVNQTTGIQNLDMASFMSELFPVPPLDEQREIADHLDRETAKIDALIAKAERFIELAQERRAALITAAVTGQIEIPTED
ncbi:restriction endonuclease subunit S [Micrococcus luteus]|uniref:restriction endonuclease subunit S n=1 Tax=Micrococcus TaxID=1269 RepID=UPI0018B0CD94|nr:restriction endonuclease subunit S [Micrococcus luteus]MCV7669691.1 restriction endonuclease subunit S [Micrococcus luteus]MCV7670688.1 restriction endonuclease subunit S [Micrococcus luteus]